MKYRVPFLSRPTVSIGITFELPSLTLQEFVREADVNYLIDTYKRTGAYYNPMTPRSGLLPEYMDISELPDVQQARETIMRAQAIFDGLPAEIRARFENDAAKFVPWAQNPTNFVELVKLGLFGSATAPEGDSAALPTEAHQPSAPAPADGPTEVPAVPGARA